MITKAVLMSKGETDNQWYVRIPIFESVGNSQALTDVNSPTYLATASYTPGILRSYKVGDVVYVAFEDNELDNIVILNKLYPSDDSNEKASGYLNVDKLYVGSNAEFVGDVSFNGIKVATIGTHGQAISNLDNITQEQEQEIGEIDERVTNLEEMFGEWVLEPNKNNLVLNIFRKRKSSTITTQESKGDNN